MPYVIQPVRVREAEARKKRREEQEKPPVITKLSSLKELILRQLDDERLVDYKVHSSLSFLFFFTFWVSKGGKIVASAYEADQYGTENLKVWDSGENEFFVGLLTRIEARPDSAGGIWVVELK